MANLKKTPEQTAASCVEKKALDITYEYQYLFGFGSIMNTTTHAPWLQTGEDQKVASLSGAVVTLKKSFGYERQWNFRSSTGFTALGVSPSKTVDHASDINGVLFRVPQSMIPSFDRREVGYQKVAIPLQHVEFHPNQPLNTNEQTSFALTAKDRMWLYVPLSSHTTYADENHPLLQSYVDTVLQGCIEWGGEEMAEHFLLTTGGWSTYFLNDTPSSRRPWLFRKEYNAIDCLLKKHSERTYYGDRRHPEEFASAFHRRMKGTWSIPRRNPNFTGREEELDRLQSRFSERDLERQRAVVQVEVAGMGGVGKTQLVIEYCYRHFPSHYGLVVWLNAESADSLVADYRQLLADLAADAHSNSSEDTDEVIGEVKTRLFRSQVPWLLVFDNLEDHNLLVNFVPRGAGMKGHVLVTTRLVDSLAVDGMHGNLILGCFSQAESLELLRRAAGFHNTEGEINTAAAQQMCHRLGNLPLAVGMSAAYMRRCDVKCSEYLDRYLASERNGRSLLRHGKLNDYSLSVASSLSLSLGAIEKESSTAGDMLRLLCFLGPDQITKPLLRHLLNAKHVAVEPEESTSTPSFVIPLTMLAGAWAVFGMSLLMPSIAGRKVTFAIALASGSVSAGLTLMQSGTLHARSKVVEESHGLRRSSSLVASFSAFEYEQSDLGWDILKSFSLLSVKDGKGSVHRLLSEAMRVSQAEDECRRNLRICVNTMLTVWTFQPDVPETWKESLSVLEHVKHVILFVFNLAGPIGPKYTLRVAHLSIEAGVFSAMALNAFVEAQTSLELALKLLESSKFSGSTAFLKARADAHHELGKIHRYHGDYFDSKRSLQAALDMCSSFRTKDDGVRRCEADTLHEMGVLEMKKHNLDSAETFLQEALNMRLYHADSSCVESNADCAATLHQLASVCVARKPPALRKAKKLLQEALMLSRQIGQRAATLKQLARVTIRQGDLDVAETYLEQALELYVELYGDNKIHINIAAVKFQQGALAMQREHLEDAWQHFSECLRIRRQVYSYARPVGSSQRDTDPTHLEVSCVLHELGRVAFAQQCFPQAMETMKCERFILQRLEEISTHSERLYQAHLTNLAWTRKCAKEMGDEDEVTRLANEKATLRKRGQKTKATESQIGSDTFSLHQSAIHCRLLARQFALGEGSITLLNLRSSLGELQAELAIVQASEIKQEAVTFCSTLIRWVDKPREARKVPILMACDNLRDVLRLHGVQVVDTISTKRKA